MPVTPDVLCSVPAWIVPSALCVTPPAVADRSSVPIGAPALPSTASASAIPAVALMVRLAAPATCRLVGLSALSWGAVISPAVTPDDPLRVIAPPDAVSEIAPALMVKPRSIVRAVPAISVSEWVPRLSVLPVPLLVATNRLSVAASEMFAFWAASRVGVTQDTVALSGAWPAPIVGRSPPTTV